MKKPSLLACICECMKELPDGARQMDNANFWKGKSRLKGRNRLGGGVFLVAACLLQIGLNAGNLFVSYLPFNEIGNGCPSRIGELDKGDAFLVVVVG